MPAVVATSRLPRRACAMAELRSYQCYFTYPRGSLLNGRDRSRCLEFQIFFSAILRTLSDLSLFPSFFVYQFLFLLPFSAHPHHFSWLSTCPFQLNIAFMILSCNLALPPATIFSPLFHHGVFPYFIIRCNFF